MARKLYKIEQGKKIFGVCGGLAEYLNIDPAIVRIVWAVLGVCGGLAEYLNIDPAIVRIVWAVLGFCWGTGIVLYLVCAFVLPNKSEAEY
jgi:phage shock protein C